MQDQQVGGRQKRPGTGNAASLKKSANGANSSSRLQDGGELGSSCSNAVAVVTPAVPHTCPLMSLHTRHAALCRLAYVLSFNPRCSLCIHTFQMMKLNHREVKGFAQDDTPNKQ